MDKPAHALALAACMLLAGCASRGDTAAKTRHRPPQVVAHRAGTADAPENTLLAIRTAVANGVDALWLSVQVSADGVAVLYRPRELATLTDGQGRVDAWSWSQLRSLNAGHAFRLPDGSHPYRDRVQPIPTLDAALAAMPRDMPVILDLKALPSPTVVDAVARDLARHDAWHRAWLYSTDAGYQALWQRYRQARQFESRDRTRQRLLTLALAQRCEQPPVSPGWAAFELRRDLQVSERFTLGQGRSAISGARLWSPAAMRCFRQQVADFSVLLIGVADQATYRDAAALGVDAVLVDSPRQARHWRLGVPARRAGGPETWLTTPAVR